MAESPLINAIILPHFAKQAEAMSGMPALAPAIAAAGDQLVSALKGGGSVWLAGNGGSAADAQHIAAEMEGRLEQERPARAVHTLAANGSTISSIGNDYGFDAVFARQVAGYVRAGDLLWLISTSGNSPNLIAAAEAARGKGVYVLGLLGKGGGPLNDLCDGSIIIPSNDTQHIQEAHITVGHILCKLVDEQIPATEDI